MKKNASFFPVFPGKEWGQIVPGYPGIGILANSFAIICTNYALKSICGTWEDDRSVKKQINNIRSKIKN